MEGRRRRRIPRRGSGQGCAHACQGPARGGPVTPAEEMRHAADGIALAGPGIDEPLRALLRVAADDHEAVEASNARADARYTRTGFDQTYVMHGTWTAHALALARAVLAEEAGEEKP